MGSFRSPGFIASSTGVMMVAIKRNQKLARTHWRNVYQRKSDELIEEPRKKHDHILT